MSVPAPSADDGGFTRPYVVSWNLTYRCNLACEHCYLDAGGSPRVGILGIETTRGDRLFISLLGSAFIHIAWLGLTSLNLWWALVLSLIYTVLVFRYV